MKSADFKKGDSVSWGTSQGKTTGKIIEKITSQSKVKGHTAHATRNDPQYKVKSDKSGAEAIHKPASLDKK